MKIDFDSPVMTFDGIFSAENLSRVFDERIDGKKSAGIDGLDFRRFAKDKATHNALINKKVLSGRYQFTPYAEIQMAKGRGKAPRILALPTIRDQVVLSALKDYLHDMFPESVNRRLPNAYIYDLNDEIGSLSGAGERLAFIRADISGFYDNIDREKLMNAVRERIDDPSALKLIHQAMTNPIVPRNNRRKWRYKYFTPIGVPQGLAISNILAAIYLCDIDKRFKASTKLWMRYVDDILILCPSADLSATMEDLHFQLARLGLKLNEEKSAKGIIGEDPFEFLGYRIMPTGHIGVRESSFQRKIASLVGKLVSADHKRDRFLDLHKQLDGKTYREVLIEDVNEQITGAYSNKKKYGWLFYFSQINDISLLHTLDDIVDQFCKRCTTLLHAKPAEIKSFVKAYREIHQLRLGKDSGYIPCYDDWSTSQKLDFLNRRGRLKEDKKYTTDEIDGIFSEFMARRLRDLEVDLKGLS